MNGRRNGGRSSRGSRPPGRDVGQRPAHLAIDRVGRQERLGVHRVEVVDAVQQRRFDAVGAQRPDDRRRG